MSSADEAGAGAAAAGQVGAGGDAGAAGAGQVGTEGGAGYGLEAGIVGDVTGSGEPRRASGGPAAGDEAGADAQDSPADGARSGSDAGTGTGTGTVVVVGSINVDQVVTVARLPRPGETLIGTGMVLLPGGKGANQAVAAARRGASTVMVGAVGDDVHAAAATPLLTESGVDTSRVEVVAGPTGLAVVSVGDDAENTIVVVPGANASVGHDAVERHADVLRSAAVVVLQGEIPADGIEHAARLATGRVLLNLAPVVAVDAEVVRLADPLVLNEHEGRLLLAALEGSASVADAAELGEDAVSSVSLFSDSPEGGPTDGSDGLGEARDADAAVVTALRQHGVPSVVLTRGSAGAIVSDATGLHHVASPRVAAVDSSGAGDAFVGALAARLAAGATLLEAAHEAVRVGAYSVTGAGTQPSYPGLGDELPSVESVDSDLDGDAAAPGDGGGASSGAGSAAEGRA
ncbi:ribokinase [Frigoribacterium sp. PvP120]|uniref:ribokinase n=1 Tax=unclassified Frigoribacterium TaxID=2627005 RepID=UPI001AE8B02E|nr:ribokinase [Frigoribacterium sp. PvP121]MBP1240330.1 ribokinase [Frigoribacterium sp. PvP121]